MATMPNSSEAKFNPPYLPFARFLESLDSISTCLPQEINRNTFRSGSFYTGKLVAKAYGFLRLTDERGTPAPVLHRLASEQGGRPEILRGILRSAYGDGIDTIQYEQAPDTIEAIIASYRLSGNTHRKAVSFLLQACRYAGIAGSSTSRGSRISHAKTSRAYPQAPIEATTVTVPLRSGGEVSLVGRFNPFTISPEDRSFVFKLVDQFAAYRSGDKRENEPEFEMEDEAPF